MPIKGRDGKYRPLGYKGEPMNQFEYNRYIKENEPLGQVVKKLRTEKKITPIKKMTAFNRKRDAKGSNYKPGKR